MNKVLNQVIEDYKVLYEREKEKRKEIQQENQQLKENYDRIYNENCKLREEHNITDISLLDENQQLKKQKYDLEKENNELQKAYALIDKSMYELMKQKDDVVEYIKKNNFKYCDDELCYMIPNHFDNLLRMLGEIDVKD